jgi:succinyl-CoA synthetase alpha subunit
MESGTIVRKNDYYDSVFLMGINKRLSELPGVIETAVVMGTEANKRLLREIGFSGTEIDAAQPNDLIVAVIAETEDAVKAAIANLDDLFNKMSVGRQPSGVRTLETALERKPEANLAVFSIPGEFVAREARNVLEAGLNAFIFSSNVPVHEELDLKRLGCSRGLLVMGPDCGTSIIGGTGIGFANRVRRGVIGVIGPSGTGLQEFTSQVHNSGGGISHAIGTGSRDLSEEIGGITTLSALDLLDDDPETEVIAIVAKPPDPKILQTLIERSRSIEKPVIGCFLGAQTPTSLLGPLQWADTIDDAVALALHEAGIDSKVSLQDAELTKSKVERIQAGWGEQARYLRGVFAGGTFCYQTQHIFLQAGLSIFSNGPIDKNYALSDPDKSREHTVVDMGDEHYTLGKPHPMIDGTERSKRILTEAKDPKVAILLLDFILGYNAANDPVGDLLEVLQEAQTYRRKIDSELTIVASICGTDEDSQELSMQAEMLQELGAHVFNSNAKATWFCLQLLEERGSAQ